MLPESVLRELLEDYINGPGMETPGWNSDGIARYVTRRTYDVLKKEKAPKASLLQAACTVLTRYVREGNDLEIYPNDELVVICGKKDGCKARSLAEALIQFADKTTD